MFTTHSGGAFRRASTRLLHPAARTAAALLMLGLACWWAPPLATAAKPAKAKRPAAKPAQPAAAPITDEELLRWLPDDCAALGWIHVPAILKSKAGRAAKIDPGESVGAYAELVGLEYGQVEWLAFGGGRQTWSRIDAKLHGVALVRSKKAFKLLPQAAADGATAWKSEEVGRRTLYVKEGITPAALTVLDEHTLLVGDPASLRAVLKRDGPAKLSEKLQQARRLLDRSKTVSVAVVLPDKIDGVDLSSLLISREIIEKIDAVLIEADFGDDLKAGVGAACRDEATALQIKGIAVALWSLLEAQGLDAQDSDLREALESVRISQDGPVVAFHMTVPASAIEKANSDDAGSSETLSALPFTPLAAPLSDLPASSLPAPAAAYGDAPSSGYSTASVFSSPVTGPVPTPPRAQPPGPPLDLRDVLRLVEAGVDEQVIGTYLQGRSLPKPLTADDLILLTEKKVSALVILMIQSLPVAPPGEGDAKKEARPKALAPPRKTGAAGPPLPLGPSELNASSQVAFLGPEGMEVRWDVSARGAFDSEPLVCPGRCDFPPRPRAISSPPARRPTPESRCR